MRRIVELRQQTVDPQQPFAGQSNKPIGNRQPALALELLERPSELLDGVHVELGQKVVGVYLSQLQLQDELADSLLSILGDLGPSDRKSVLTQQGQVLTPAIDVLEVDVADMGERGHPGSQ